MSIQNALRIGVSVAKELEANFALVGGLAASYWGSKRRTQDVDLVLLLNPSKVNELRSIADEHNLTYISSFLVGFRFETVDEVQIDFLIASNNIERVVLKTAIPAKVFGVNVLCADINELLAMKWAAHRERDLEDINYILKAHADKIDRVKINKLLPLSKKFTIEPDGSPWELKKASLDELRFLATRDKTLATRIRKIATRIDKLL